MCACVCLCVGVCVFPCARVSVPVSSFFLCVGVSICLFSVPFLRLILYHTHIRTPPVCLPACLPLPASLSLSVSLDAMPASRLANQQPAAEQRALMEGDIILSANGVELLGRSVPAASRVLPRHRHRHSLRGAVKAQTQTQTQSLRSTNNARAINLVCVHISCACVCVT